MHSDDFRNDQPALGELAGSGIMGQAQLSPRWRSDEGLSPAINTEKEFNKFQIRANEPTARAAEQKVFNDYRSQGLYPWNLTSRPELDWSEGKQDILGWQVRPGNIERINPVTNAGITNPNLNGYKVWNAGGVQDKIDSWLGPLIEKNVDLENWEPTPWDFGIGNWIKNKINPGAQNELLKKELEELYIKQDEARMHPYFPAPGPWNEFYPGDVEHINDFLFEDEGIEPYEWDESAGTELAQSQWKRPENMEKTIKSLELRPEFEGWTHDEIKYWIINQARANRGGIIGLI